MSFLTPAERFLKSTAASLRARVGENMPLVYHGFFSLMLLAAMLSGTINFLNFIEPRQGVVVPDPLIQFFPPVDLSKPIFALLYFSMILGILHTARDLRFLLPGLQGYALLLLFRMICIFLVPLAPPENMILLNDPFVQYFSESNQIFTRDLFFSGHTATLLYLMFVVRPKWLKVFFLVGSVLMGLMLMIQKAHYSYDVFAAIPFAWLSWAIVVRLHQKSRFGLLSEKA